MKRILFFGVVLILMSVVAFAAESLTLNPKCDVATFIEFCCTRGDNLSVPYNKLESVYRDGCGKEEGALSPDEFSRYIESEFIITQRSFGQETVPYVEGIDFAGQSMANKDIIVCVDACIAKGETKDKCTESCNTKTVA
ncbi:MAG: hypothetical protein AABW59_03765 [archaeon]